MSNLTDDIRLKMAVVIAAANAVIGCANQIDSAMPPPPAVWPMPLDCLAGAPMNVPVMNPIGGVEQDMQHWSVRTAQFGTDSPQLHAGTVLFIGDSIFERMNVAAASPWAYNMGISGDTMRGLLNRITRFPIIHQCGAVVVLMGINDLVWEGMTYSVGQAIADVDYMWDLLAPAIRGKWLVLKVLPINEEIYPNKAIKNSDIDQVNAYLVQKFAGNTQVTVLDLKPLLTDGSGQLNPAYTDANDGVHPNAAGFAVIAPAIAAALHALGVQ